MTPFEQAVTEIELDGFTLIPDVLKQDEIDALREALKRCAEQTAAADEIEALLIQAACSPTPAATGA